MKFESKFKDAFPGRPLVEGMRSVQTPGVMYAQVIPETVSAPSLIAWSDNTAALMGLPSEAALRADPEALKLWTEVLAGNKLLEGMQPIATRYGGHQFGNWAGQLGDGRATLLGNLTRPDGLSLELQLKGAGKTPYSRHADGRAVLRSSLREYLCSEAMYHLGIPTTRALACVLTGDLVVRDMFYDGNPEPEPGAITTRVSPSFVRFGHFEILAANGELDLLKRLIRYVIKSDYPQYAFSDDVWDEELVVSWFGEVCKKTAWLMSEWLRVGFVHGVMNTDNMSILGLTIDYGPYGWLDHYDPTWTPNTTDFERRRYRYENQPGIGHWNLVKLAEALSTVLTSIDGLKTQIESYADTFKTYYRDMRYRKLGLTQKPSLKSEDDTLIEMLDGILVKAEVDYTILYRKLADWIQLSEVDAGSLTAADTLLMEVVYQDEGQEKLDGHLRAEFHAWLRLYRQRVLKEDRSQVLTARQMNLQNPYFVLRNYIVQECLDAMSQEDFASLSRLQKALETPYLETCFTSPYFKKRPTWARTRPGCSALSCSS